MKAIAIAVAIMLSASFVCMAGGPAKTEGPQSPMIASDLKVGLHLITHGVKGCGKAIPSLTGVGDLVRTWSLTGDGSDVDAFYVIFDYDSLLMYEYALTWPSDWGTGTFSACPGPIVVGAITNPGDGAAFSYPTCQIAVHAGGTAPNCFIGSYTWFIPLSDGQINILPNPATNDLLVINCMEPAYLRTKYNPSITYGAAVNVDPYTGPPMGVATEPTTWGAIKAMFE